MSDDSSATKSTRKVLCFVITRLIAGGAQKIVLDLIKYIDRSVFDIHLISGIETGHEGNLWPEAESLLEKGRLHQCKSLVRNVSPIKDFTAYFEIKKLLRAINPDIVHTHTSKAGIIGRLAAHSIGIKRIIHAPHGSMFDKGSNIPGVSGKKILMRFFKWLEHFVGYRTHCIITLSEKETGQSLHLDFCQSNKITCIPNGIPLSDFSKIEHAEYDKTKEVIRLGNAGRLNEEKGHELLLIAFQHLLKKFPNLKLEIAGEGPLGKSLAKQAHELGIQDHVTFHGFVQNVADFFASIDIFVLSSHYEGFGLVLVEAMASGLPVVATDVGGVREVVTDGETGLIVPPDSETELELGIEYFLQHPSLVRSFGAKGREKAMQKYSMEYMVKAHTDLYENAKEEEDDSEIAGKNLYAIDLHLHSKFSFDCRSDIDSIIKNAKKNGLRAIAITDHDEIEGSVKAAQLSTDELIIIPGIEVSTDAGDIIGLFIDKPITSTVCNEVVEEIKNLGGLVCIPHPFRSRHSLPIELVSNVDIIEICNGRSYDRYASRSGDLVALAAEYKKTGIGGSDAHKVGEVARTKTFVPAFSSSDELKKILASGNIHPILFDEQWVTESLSQ